jgi:hypothetical protein
MGRVAARFNPETAGARGGRARKRSGLRSKETHVRAGEAATVDRLQVGWLDKPAAPRASGGDGPTMNGAPTLIVNLALGVWLGVGVFSSQAIDPYPAAPGVPAPPQVLAPDTNAMAVPKIEFATMVYDFGRRKVGEPVQCEFVFTNTGGAVLQVTSVHPGCGCTTTGNWTREVPPGQTGVIPVQFNGVAPPGMVSKAITVTCNDPARSTVVLQIRGTLWKPIEVTPQFAVFNVTEEAVTNASTVVRVINNEDAPLALLSAECNNPFFRAAIITNQPGKEFEVHIRPVPPLPSQNVGGVITLKTTSTNAPSVSINCAAILVPTLAVNPPSIILPPPGTNQVRPVIYVRNNGPTPFKLSEPLINAPDVSVQINEVEPGKFATVMLTFPPEFALPQGQSVHLKVKTGLANPAELDVPVFQRPAPPQAAN